MEKSEIKGYIAKRVAKELKDGDVVNLGIGLPTLVPNYLPEGVHVTLQSENGIIGTGTLNDSNRDPLYVTDAGGSPAAVALGGAFIDSATSFGLIRGGHVDATVLGTLQVDQEGNIANWIVPGKVVPGMGGAMDLCAGVKKIVVATDHCEKSGSSKIMKKCTLPLTGAKCVTDIVTERCYFQVTPNGLVLKELAPGYTVEDIRACTEADFTVAEDLGVME